MNKFVFVGPFFDDRPLSEYNSLAACYFSKKIIELFSVDYKVQIDISTNSRIPVKALIIKFFKFFKEVLRFYRLNRFNRGTVFLYNLNFYTLLFRLILSFTKNNFVLIILDYSPNNFKDRIFKYVYTVCKFVKKDKLVFLRKNTLSYFDSKKYFITPGISIDLVHSSFEHKVFEMKDFIYCGKLSSSRNLDLLFDLSASVGDSNIHFFGDHLNLSSNYKNILVHGLVDYSVLIKFKQKCLFGIDLRDPSSEENNFNFPSKILEYIEFGLIPICNVKFTDFPSLIIFSFDDIPLLLELEENDLKGIILENKKNLDILAGKNFWLKSVLC